SLLMALGAVAIALASATGAEHRHWQEAAAREGARYGIDPAYVRAALAGESSSASPSRRTWLDWTLVGGATATFIGFGMVARVPRRSRRRTDDPRRPTGQLVANRVGEEEDPHHDPDHLSGRELRHRRQPDRAQAQLSELFDEIDADEPERTDLHPTLRDRSR